MKDKTVIITGATSGIGRVAAESLAQQGAQVVVVGRDESRCVETIEKIQRSTGNQSVSYQLADFTSLAEVQQLSKRVLDSYNRIDVLINNAGGFYLRRLVSRDGYEMTLAVNHLASFLLTFTLLPRLQASAPARIINVSSGLHARTDNPNWPTSCLPMNLIDAIGRLGLAQTPYTRALWQPIWGEKTGGGCGWSCRSSTCQQCHLSRVPKIRSTSPVHPKWKGSLENISSACSRFLPLQHLMSQPRLRIYGR